MSELFVRPDDETKNPLLEILKKLAFGQPSTAEKASAPQEVVNWKQLRARSASGDELRGKIAVALAQSLKRENELP